MKYLFALLALSALPVFADVSGVWNVEGDIAGNPIIAACTLKQEEAKLSGACKSELGNSDLTGSVDTDKVKWQYEIEYQGMKYTLVYEAKLDSETSMKGTVSVASGEGDGAFSAKKQ
jgi:hypothetical protein